MYINEEKLRQAERNTSVSVIRAEIANQQPVGHVFYSLLSSHEGLLDLVREVSKWLWLNVKTVLFPTQFFMTVSYTHGRKYDNLTNCSHAIMCWAQIK